MSAAIAHRLVAASGGWAGDCAFLAQRFEARDGDFRPGSGETYVCTMDGEEATLVFGGVAWFTGIWRSPRKTIFVSDADGAMHVLRAGSPRRSFDLDASLIGVWGLDDEVVWAWGSGRDGPALFRWNGAAWSAVACPGPIVAMHGPDVSTIIAVGYGGLIASFDGRSWTVMESPVSQTLNGVCVISDDEAYAIGPEGVILEGSTYGFVEQTRVDHALYSIAPFRGTIYVGGPEPTALMRLDRGGLVPVKKTRPALCLDGREQLLVTTAHVIASTTDLDTWAAIPVETFERLVASIPPEWR